MKRFLSRKVLVLAGFMTAVVTISSVAEAQMQQMASQMRWQIGAPVPLSQTFEVMTYRPPFASNPAPVALGNVVGTGRPTLYVYMDANQPASIESVKDTVAYFKTNKLDKVDLLIIAKSAGPNDRNAAISFVQKESISYPLLLDSAMQVALGLQAFRLPAYGIIDQRGILKVAGIRGLDKLLKNGEKLGDALKRINKGAAVPTSEGEKILDIKTLIGSTAPDFDVKGSDLTSAARKQVSNKDVKGKPYLMVFWMATCPHCQREMPRITEWYGKNKGNIELIAVTNIANPRTRDFSKNYIKDRKLSSLPVYEGNPPVYKEWRVEGIPAWAMVGRNGKVVAANVGERESLESELDAALKLAKK